MSCNGYGNCDQPTEKRFMGKEYCWDCYHDLKEKWRDDPEPPPSEEEEIEASWDDDDKGCSPMWEKRDQ
jgi:hypothetical protein